MLNVLNNPTVEDMAMAAGLESYTGDVRSGVTKVITERFAAIYDHLTTSIFHSGALDAMYPDPSKRVLVLNQLSGDQKKFKAHSAKLGYLNITGAPCPSIVGLKGSLFDYSNLLADYADFGARVIKSLRELNRVLAETINIDDSLRSISMIGQYNKIDMHVKYRAKFNDELQRFIGANTQTTETPYGNLVRSNKEMYQVVDQRNVFDKTVNENTKDEVEGLVKRIGSLIDTLAGRISDENESANGKVVSAISSTLFQSGQLVRDYGVYLHRLNALVGAVDGIVYQVGNYTPEHIKEAVSEAVAIEQRKAGLNDDAQELHKTALGDYPRLEELKAGGFDAGLNADNPFASGWKAILKQVGLEGADLLSTDGINIDPEVAQKWFDKNKSQLTEFKAAWLKLHGEEFKLHRWISNPVMPNMYLSQRMVSIAVSAVFSKDSDKVLKQVNQCLIECQKMLGKNYLNSGKANLLEMQRVTKMADHLAAVVVDPEVPVNTAKNNPAVKEGLSRVDSLAEKEAEKLVHNWMNGYNAIAFLRDDKESDAIEQRLKKLEPKLAKAGHVLNDSMQDLVLAVYLTVIRGLVYIYQMGVLTTILRKIK